MDILEDRLKAAYGVIRESKDMNPNCRGYALPSLCYSILPVCRTPEKTNHQYFANRAEDEAAKRVANAGRNRNRQQEKKTNNNKRMSMKSGATTTSAPTTTSKKPTTTEKLLVFFEGGVTPEDVESDVEIVTENSLKRRKRDDFDPLVRRKLYFQQGMSSWEDNISSFAAPVSTKRVYPPTRNTENLRRICRDDCELLENELCQKEYAIAKRHPTIGQKLPLEECYDLPQQSTTDDKVLIVGEAGATSEGTVDCMRMGIKIDIVPEDDCYWENGSSYRGTMDVSSTGKSCLKWVRVMREISDHPELAGHNYCR